MIRKKDFIDAIGEPNASFETAVANALGTVRRMAVTEEHVEKRRYGMIFPVAAAAAILIAFTGFMVNGPMSEKPDPIKAPGALSQPRDTITPEPDSEFTMEAEREAEYTPEAEQTLTATPEPETWAYTPEPETEIYTPVPETWAYTPEPETESAPAQETDSAPRPTAAPEVQATLEAELPYDVSYDGVTIDRPGYYDLFERAFGQGFDALLDEGYSYEQTWLMDDDTLCWVAGNGKEQYIICRLLEDGENVVFSVDMPNFDGGRTEDFMAGTPEWLTDLYYGQADSYLEGLTGIADAISGDYPLNTLEVMVDKNGEPLAVKMSFGSEAVVKISWEKQDSGVLDIASGYVDDLLVFGYDTIFDANTDEGIETIDDAGHYRLFMQIFDREITDFYFDYEISRIIKEDEQTTAYYMSADSEDEILACRINEVQQLNGEDEEEELQYSSITLYMLDDAGRIAVLIGNAPQWLQTLYYEDASQALNALLFDRDFPLAEVTVLAEPDGKPYACKMVFGRTEQCYIWWEADDNGDFKVKDFGMT